MPLTDIQIRKLNPVEKPKKHTDADGLYLLQNPSGSRLWRMKYRFGGKEKLLAFGSYPEISLKRAREMCREAREKIAEGIDPGIKPEAPSAGPTFREMACEWFENMKDKWAPAHAGKVFARLENYAFPVLGNQPLAAISPKMVLDSLRVIENRGARETAHRALSVISQVFRYAVACDKAERDVCADLKGALKPAISKSFATITDPKEIGQLLRAIDAYHGSVIVKSALRLAPYVFVRPGELRMAEWKEIDLDKAEWRIPAAKMKMRQQHIVPLARQSLEILREIAQYTGEGQYVFHGLRKKSGPISDATVLNALRSMGYEQDRMCVHGFRGMASTRLNEMGYNPDWIERQLAHSQGNKIRAAYNYAQWLTERRKMMQEWADYLDRLRDGT